MRNPPPSIRRPHLGKPPGRWLVWREYLRNSDTGCGVIPVHATLGAQQTILVGASPLATRKLPSRGRGRPVTDLTPRGPAGMLT